ncbi:MerR family transcriptional regulator [Ligilactobacillus faecis]|uniref:MerR family transcriptional regulator n=1 Tax=Ligilactobacillus faecis TaxID=762833 RepID=A0ABV4DQZ2_9LACO
MKVGTLCKQKEVSQLFGLSIDTLRYYERIGIIPPIARDKNGYRDYKTTDLNWIYLVKTLRKTGMPINALQKYTRLSQKSFPS